MNHFSINFICRILLPVVIAVLFAGPVHLRAAVSSKSPHEQNTKPAQRPKGLTADEVTFIEATRKGDNSVVAKYLNAGMDANLIDKRDDELSSVLMVAAMAGQTETAKLLLNHGAHINAKTKKGRTALTWASWRGMTETVQALLAAGADLNTRDQWGSTPLSFAVSKGRVETVKVLLDAGAKVNIHHTMTGQTPLIDAVIRGYIDIVRLLLDKGANAKEQDGNGRKPIDWARRVNRPDIEILLKKAMGK